MSRSSPNTHLSVQAVLALWVTAFGLSSALAADNKKSSSSEWRREVSQYGITWTFREPHQVGQFVTGDWWVVGPVEVIRVSPAPGPASEGEQNGTFRNKFGDTTLQKDDRMRNGSMIVLEGSNRQGYDSRAINYAPRLSVAFPLKLEANQSLISTTSNRVLPNPNFCHKIMWKGEKKEYCALRSAAVLTSLATPPPADAFRPPYGGRSKPIYQAKDLQWQKLAQLPSVGPTPSWEEFERYFERPWIDHEPTWMARPTAPNENMPAYGREYARLVSMASLMLQLDVPNERKEKLLLGLVQLGIDLQGLHQAGVNWNRGGGLTSGRKWPIFFAGLMLDQPELYDFPLTSVFHEDAQTYYDQDTNGKETALWWLVNHHGPRRRYELLPRDQWEHWDKVSENYRTCCTTKAWIGSSLAARYMRAIERWDHNAYFDYCDRWMRESSATFAPPFNPEGNFSNRGKTLDPWVDAMWKAHRKTAPEQPRGPSRRWWTYGKQGYGWEPNPPR